MKSSIWNPLPKNVVKHPRFDIAMMDYNELRAELDFARLEIERLTQLNKELYEKLGKTC